MAEYNYFTPEQIAQLGALINEALSPAPTATAVSSLDKDTKSQVRDKFNQHAADKATQPIETASVGYNALHRAKQARISQLEMMAPFSRRAMSQLERESGVSKWDFASIIKELNS